MVSANIYNVRTPATIAIFTDARSLSITVNGEVLTFLTCQVPAYCLAKTRNTMNMYRYTPRLLYRTHLYYIY